jgi:tetratricopeptide (TPR) repeat protein
VHSLIAYIVVASAGLLLALFLTRAPELRCLRLSQLIFVPIGFVAALAVLPEPSAHADVGDIGAFVLFLGILGFLIILLAPNIAHVLGSTVSDFLDPHDWKPIHEEIPLRSVVRLIDKGRNQDALAELEKLLKEYRPNYDALHLKAKLLNHFQHFDETIDTLLQMMRLSSTATQQLVVMELLASLESHRNAPQKAPVPGTRQIQISHALVLFNTGHSEPSVHKEIPPGSYLVEEILQGRHRWLVLTGEPWGNAEVLWKAVQGGQSAVKKGFLYHVARLQQKFTFAIKGKPWRQAKADAGALHKEANEYIRLGDWGTALPLLQKASAEDPDNYEIAYRLVQASRQAGPSTDVAELLDKVLAQSRWTEDQERMLKQLRF